MIDWNNLWVATALMLIIEGLLPFLSPDGLRRALITMVQMSDRALRITGLVSMIIGVALLYLVR
ncbi:DUF2065 domain-containing protein [Candidatus Reidiella endopervernicosa]|uniref:DUF2065 domain-containing protein n=1 Tax=Candidatus Reidiella endopervernicosa TaxID=2738883 RepID=A0A6N0HV73_9GAMM|nr:DUF2065 domain-containing protein [Candidatus Reidiella endopervernicosa]QKQ26248.1 DUF2065 domain-containing protein [Candidatus Reidiella endopervernicosa]